MGPVGVAADPVDAAADPAGVVPVAGHRAVGRPIERGVRGLAFAVETAPNATSTVTAIADAGGPAAGRARGTATTARRAAIDPGSPAANGRPSEATGRVSRVPRSASVRGGSRAAQGAADSNAAKAGPRIAVSIVRAPRGRAAGLVAGREPRSGPARVSGAGQAVVGPRAAVSTAAAREPAALDPAALTSTDGRRPAPIRDLTGRGHGRSDPRTRGTSRALTSPVSSVPKRSSSPDAGRWRRRSSPDARPTG